MIIPEILDSAGVDVHESTSQDYETTICCPFCVERGFPPDTGFHLGVNVKRGLAHCFRCDWKARGVMYLARHLCRAYGVKLELKRPVREEREERAEKEKPAPKEPVLVGLPAEYETFTPTLDHVGKCARNYLRTRGVSTLQIVKHKIGFAAAGDYTWRVLFPVIDDKNRIHGCVGRAIRSDMAPKYLNTPGMKLLWNARDCSGTAVVVEGIMDALRVETALLQRRHMTAVARLGSAITNAQLDQLKDFDSVVVLPDWDRAGVHGAIELCSRCDARGIRASVSIPRLMDGRDPGDMFDEEILELIGDAVQWNNVAECRLRLAATKESPVVAIR